jgi:hypothetical protein
VLWFKKIEKIRKALRVLESDIDFFFCLLARLEKAKYRTRLQPKNGGENKPQSFRRLQKTYNYEPVFCTCFE